MALPCLASPILHHSPLTIITPSTSSSTPPSDQTHRPSQHAATIPHKRIPTRRTFTHEPLFLLPIVPRQLFAFFDISLSLHANVFWFHKVGQPRGTDAPLAVWAALGALAHHIGRGGGGRSAAVVNEGAKEVDAGV